MANEYVSPYNYSCLPCPDNTMQSAVGRAICECKSGYFRASSETADFSCTRKIAGAVGVSAEIVNQLSTEFDQHINQLTMWLCYTVILYDSVVQVALFLLLFLYEFIKFGFPASLVHYTDLVVGRKRDIHF